MAHYRMVCGPVDNEPRSAVALVIAQRRAATLQSVNALVRARDYASRQGFANAVAEMNAAIADAQASLAHLNAAEQMLQPNFD